MRGTFPGARAPLRTAVIRLRAETCFCTPRQFGHAGVGRDCTPVLCACADDFLVGFPPQRTRISAPVGADLSNAPAARRLSAGGASATAPTAPGARPVSSLVDVGPPRVVFPVCNFVADRCPPDPNPAPIRSDRFAQPSCTSWSCCGPAVPDEGAQAPGCARRRTAERLPDGARLQLRLCPVSRQADLTGRGARWLAEDAGGECARSRCAQCAKTQTCTHVSVSLLARVEAGEEIVIARRGNPGRRTFSSGAADCHDPPQTEAATGRPQGGSQYPRELLRPTTRGSAGSLGRSLDDVVNSRTW